MKNEPLLQEDITELRKELLREKLKSLFEQGLNPKQAQKAIIEDDQLNELNNYEAKVMAMSPEQRMQIPKSEIDRFRTQ